MQLLRRARYRSFVNLDDLLESRLAQLRDRDLLREPESPLLVRAQAAAVGRGVSLLNAAGNDYLGLGPLPVSRETSGAGASRLLGGSRTPHERLEAALATWLGTESALLFSSGYAANVGVLSALVRPGEAVLSDALNHASIIDGCRLSRGETLVYPHRDLDALGELLAAAPRPCWVVTEAYFSMDGTSPDVAALRHLCDASGAFLLVDEAHSLGVFGDGGRGLCSRAGVRPDLLTGTFGKAFGAHGAFVAGSRSLRTFLWNQARSFVFSTATSPALAQTILDRLPRVVDGDVARARLQTHGDRLAASLEAAGFETPEGRHGPIFPVLLGSASRAIQAAEHLADHGILAPPIRPPTVPEGSSRVRFTLSAAHSDDDVSRATLAWTTLAPR